MMSPQAFVRRSLSVRASYSILQPLRPILHTKPYLNQIVRHATRLGPEIAAADTRSVVARLTNFFFGTSIVLGLAFGYLYVTDTRSGLHRWIVVPSIRYIYPDAEDAHHAGTKIMKAMHIFGIHPRERGDDDSKGDLAIEVFGQRLVNPLGISAGLDKNGDVPSALLELGPAVVEIGGVTPLPQEGNAKPRVFRIPSQNALINRYGLNSEGAERVAMRLRQRVREYAYHLGLGIGEDAEKLVLDGRAGVPPGSLVSGKLLAVQVAKNKNTPDNDIDAVRRDYVTCVEKLAKYADIIVVNVSSPNTPGLRELQKSEPLQHILTGVVGAARAVDRKTKPAVMVKVSPDEDSDDEVMGIAEAVWMAGVDGVIVGNTTKKRPDAIPTGYTLQGDEATIANEMGGFSGPHLFGRTLALVEKYRRTLDQGLASEDNGDAAQKVIFCTGGVATGSQALQLLNAGASVAMVYTALVYGGVGTISRIKDEMRAELLKSQVAR